jgi:hypothetical protein
MPSIEPRATLDVARSTEMSETMINPPSSLRLVFGMRSPFSPCSVPDDSVSEHFEMTRCEMLFPEQLATRRVCCMGVNRGIISLVDCLLLQMGGHRYILLPIC